MPKAAMTPRVMLSAKPVMIASKNGGTDATRRGRLYLRFASNLYVASLTMESMVPQTKRMIVDPRLFMSNAVAMNQGMGISVPAASQGKIKNGNSVSEIR